MYFDDKLYLLGTNWPVLDSAQTTLFYEYDLLTFSWSLVQILGHALPKLVFHKAFAYNESMFVLYGYDLQLYSTSKKISR